MLSQPWHLSQGRPAPAVHGAGGRRAEALATELVEIATSATPAVARAVAHTLWGLGHWGRTGDRGVQVAACWVASGCGVGDSTARAAAALVADATGATRHRGWWTLPGWVLGACWEAARALHGLGTLRTPVGATVVDGEGSPVELDGERGRCRCPCGGHANGDRRPSGAFDVVRRRLTCQVTGAVLVLRRVFGGWTAHRKATDQGVDSPTNAKGCPDRREGLALGGLRWAGAPRHLEPKARPSRPGVCTHHLPTDTDGAVLTRGSPLWWRGSWGWLMRRRSETPTVEEHGVLDTLDPVGLETLGTSRVLFDLDGLDLGNTSVYEAGAVSEILAGSVLFDGADSVVDTSLHGTQVVAHLTWWRTSPGRFYRDAEVRAELARLGGAIVERLGRAGHADPAVWAPGRLARLPGWRTKRGVREYARLVALPLADWWAR